MSDKSDLIDGDVIEIYDLAWSQAREDREIVMDLYKDLRVLVSGSAERYAVCGDTLAKYAELLTKQTGQVIELLKIVHKNKQSDESLTEAEIDKITQSISNKDE